MQLFHDAFTRQLVHILAASKLGMNPDTCEEKTKLQKRLVRKIIDWW